MRILTYSLLLALAGLLGSTPALRAQEPHRNPLAAAEETAAEEMAPRRPPTPGRPKRPSCAP